MATTGPWPKHMPRTLDYPRVGADAILAACADGRVESLVGVLAPDVVLRSDGGGLDLLGPGPRQLIDHEHLAGRLVRRQALGGHPMLLHGSRQLADDAFMLPVAALQFLGGVLVRVQIGGQIFHALLLMLALVPQMDDFACRLVVFALQRLVLGLCALVVMTSLRQFARQL